MRKKKNKQDNNKKSLNLIIVVSCLIIAGIIAISCILGSNSGEEIYTLEINGDSNIVVYKGNIYHDLGAKAYDSEENDLSSEILVNNNVNVNRTGSYEITYTLGNMSVTRIVKVIEKPSVDSNTDSSDDKSDTSADGKEEKMEKLLLL